MNKFLPSSPPAPRSRRRMAGVSMIELLVAFVIFSFGMLGLAGLQSRMLTFNQSSLLRSQAAALTDDVLDRMRVDRTNAIDGKWDVTAGGATTNTDLDAWLKDVAALLPAGKAAVTMDKATDNTVTITIQWNDSRGTDRLNTSGIEEFQTVSRL